MKNKKKDWNKGFGVDRERIMGCLKDLEVLGEGFGKKVCVGV